MNIPEAVKKGVLVKRRRIAIVTTSRAEYGLLYWLIRGVHLNPNLELRLIAAGMHLSPEFGQTSAQIEADGFLVSAKVEMLLSSDTSVGTAKSIGIGVLGFSDAFQRLAPDLLIVLGDRFELLAACTAALAMRIPIAHIHGGESTEGVIDEQVRHAITKMAYLHFVSAEPHRRRVIQMGEHPARVFNVGAPGLEYIERMVPYNREALERQLNFKLEKPMALVTYHPEDSPGADGRDIDVLLDVLKDSAFRSVITYANADAGGRMINEKLERFQREHPRQTTVQPSLGHQSYLSLMRHVEVVIGNSSSGILEVPSFRIPTVNVGDRQLGRLRAPSIIDCKPTRQSLRMALSKAFSPDFKREHCRGGNPYGGGKVSEKIIKIIRSFDLGQGPIRKPFYDLSFPPERVRRRKA